MALDMPVGKLLMTRLAFPITSKADVRIDRADPKIRISNEAIEYYVRHWEPTADGYGWVAYDWGHLDYGASPVGAVLTFADSDRSVTYLLSEYEPQTRTWLAEWPD